MTYISALARAADGYPERFRDSILELADIDSRFPGLSESMPLDQTDAAVWAGLVVGAVPFGETFTRWAADHAELLHHRLSVDGLNRFVHAKTAITHLGKLVFAPGAPPFFQPMTDETVMRTYCQGVRFRSVDRGYSRG